MNCCEQSAPTSGCNQGRNCPVRSSRITSEQAGEAARLMDAYWHHTRHATTTAQDAPTWPPAEANRDDTASPIPAEAGNVWFVDSELTPLSELQDADEWRPLTTREYLIVITTVLVFRIAWLVLVGAFVGYAWQQWAGAWVQEAARAVLGGLLS